MGFLDRLFPRTGQARTNTHLTRALAALASNDTSDTRHSFYQALLDSTFLVPSPAGGEEESAATLEPEPPIITVKDDEGRVVWPVFTDAEALLAWQPEGGDYLTLRSDTLFPIAQHHSEIAAVVINMAGPVSRELSRQEIQRLAFQSFPDDDTALPKTDAPNVRVTYPPAPPSEPTVAAILQTLPGYPEVLSAYIFEVAVSSGQPHLVLGVLMPEADEATTRKIIQDLSSRVSLQGGEYLDFMPLKEGSEMLREARKLVAPIYQRTE